MKWATALINLTIPDGLETTLQLNSVLPATQEVDVTLVRTIICLTVRATSVGSIANAQQIHVGIGVASSEGFAAGAVGVASPATAAEDPIQGWVWKCSYWLTQSQGTDSMALQIEKDLRAQRKISAGVPYFRLDNDPGDGVAFTVRVHGIIRTLYKLA